MALVMASASQDVALVRQLVQSGVSVDQQDSGWTPLLHAAFNGNQEIAEVLLQSGAQVDLADAQGSSPLYTASCYGHSEVVKLLLKFGAEIDKPMENGCFPVLIAAFKGHSEVVDILAMAGADLDKTWKGKSAADCASRKGHFDIVESIANQRKLRVAVHVIQSAVRALLYRKHRRLAKDTGRASDSNVPKTATEAPGAEGGGAATNGFDEVLVAVENAVEEEEREIVLPDGVQLLDFVGEDGDTYQFFADMEGNAVDDETYNRIMVDNGLADAIPASEPPSAAAVETDRRGSMARSLVLDSPMNSSRLQHTQMAQQKMQEAQEWAEQMQRELRQKQPEPEADCSARTRPHDEPPPRLQVTGDCTDDAALARDETQATSGDASPQPDASLCSAAQPCLSTPAQSGSDAALTAPEACRQPSEAQAARSDASPRPDAAEDAALPQPRTSLENCTQQAGDCDVDRLPSSDADGNRPQVFAGTEDGAAAEDLTVPNDTAAVDPIVTDGTAAVDSTVADDTAAVDSTVADDTAAVDSTVTDATAAVDLTTADDTAVDSTVTDATAAVDLTTADDTAVDSTVTDATAAVDLTTADDTAVDSTVTDATAAVDLTIADDTAVDSTVADDTPAVDLTVADDTAAVDSTIADATAAFDSTIAVDSTFPNDTATLDSTANGTVAVDSGVTDDTAAVDSTANDTAAVDSTVPNAVDPTANDASAVDSTADDTVAINSAVTAAVDSTANDTVAIDSTVPNAAVVDLTADDAAAANLTADDAAAVDLTPCDFAAVDSSIADAVAVDSTAAVVGEAAVAVDGGSGDSELPVQHVEVGDANESELHTAAEGKASDRFDSNQAASIDVDGADVEVPNSGQPPARTDVGETKDAVGAGDEAPQAEANRMDCVLSEPQTRDVPTADLGVDNQPLSPKPMDAEATTAATGGEQWINALVGGGDVPAQPEQSAPSTPALNALSLQQKPLEQQQLVCHNIQTSAVQEALAAAANAASSAVGVAPSVRAATKNATSAAAAARVAKIEEMALTATEVAETDAVAFTWEDIVSDIVHEIVLERVKNTTQTEQLAATYIQSVVRGGMGRREARRRRGTEHELQAGAFLSRCVRGFLGRVVARRQRRLRDLSTKARIGHLVGLGSFDSYVPMSPIHAPEGLSFFTGPERANRMRCRFRKESCAVVIQAAAREFVRRMLAYRRRQHIRLQRRPDSAATMLANCVSEFLRRRRARRFRRGLEREMAASRIQEVARGHQSRKRAPRPQPKKASLSDHSAPSDAGGGDNAFGSDHPFGSDGYANLPADSLSRSVSNAYSAVECVDAEQARASLQVCVPDGGPPSNSHTPSRLSSSHARASASSRASPYPAGNRPPSQAHSLYGAASDDDNALAATHSLQRAYSSQSRLSASSPHANLSRSASQAYSFPGVDVGLAPSPSPHRRNRPPPQSSHAPSPSPRRPPSEQQHAYSPRAHEQADSPSAHEQGRSSTWNLRGPDEERFAEGALSPIEAPIAELADFGPPSVASTLAEQVAHRLATQDLLSPGDTGTAVTPTTPLDEPHVIPRARQSDSLSAAAVPATQADRRGSCASLEAGDSASTDANGSSVARDVGGSDAPVHAPAEEARPRPASPPAANARTSPPRMVVPRFPGGNPLAMRYPDHFMESKMGPSDNFLSNQTLYSSPPPLTLADTGNWDRRIEQKSSAHFMTDSPPPIVKMHMVTSPSRPVLKQKLPPPHRDLSRASTAERVSLHQGYVAYLSDDLPVLPVLPPAISPASALATPSRTPPSPSLPSRDITVSAIEKYGGHRNPQLRPVHGGGGGRQPPLSAGAAGLGLTYSFAASPNASPVALKLRAGSAPSFNMGPPPHTHALARSSSDDAPSLSFGPPSLDGGGRGGEDELGRWDAQLPPSPLPTRSHSRQSLHPLPASKQARTPPPIPKVHSSATSHKPKLAPLSLFEYAMRSK